MWVFEGKNNSKGAAAAGPGPTHPTRVSILHYLKGRNAVAAPAPHNAVALVWRQINGLLDPPLPFTLGHPAGSMKRLGDYASPEAGLERARG